MESNNQQMINGMALNTYVGLMNILFIVPSLGWIISLVFWVIGKDKSEYVNVRGKDMLNWMISLVIYSVAVIIVGSIISVLIPVVGVIIFFILGGVLGIYALACPIIGGIKGFNGEDWRYPYTIRLIK